MKGKSLCVTCVYDNTCTFTRKFPILFCEEFSIESRKKTLRKVELKRRKAKKHKQ